jgi:hypothetical protein
METKWQIGLVKLANGEEAFVDAINEGQEDWRYTGRIKQHGQWVSAGWDDTGRRMYSELNHPGNLALPPKKTILVQRWMVVYENGGTCVFMLQSEAIAEARMYGFALIPIGREVTEGEGL